MHQGSMKVLMSPRYSLCPLHEVYLEERETLKSRNMGLSAIIPCPKVTITKLLPGRFCKMESARSGSICLVVLFKQQSFHSYLLDMR